MDLMQKFLTAPVDFFLNYGGPFILVLSILVFVHEWGHYIIARMCGVRVESFSIGFGKEIFGRTDKNGTRWKFSLIPLGGYVQMFGDVDPASTQKADGVAADDGTVRAYTTDERKVAFFNQSVGKRAAIVFAGPAINFIFAIILLTGLYATEGQPYTPAVAAKVTEGMPAFEAGVRPDDKVISAGGQKVVRFQDLVNVVGVNLDQDLELVILRAKPRAETAPIQGEGADTKASVPAVTWDETPVTLTVKPKLIVETDRFGFKHSVGRIGLVAPEKAFEMEQHSLMSAFVAANKSIWRISVDTLRSIGQMIMGYRSTDELGGILRIGAYAGEFAQAGLISLISFTAILSVNLGLVNLFPIPMLDGGHLAFYAMETVKGKPISDKFQEYALRMGMIFLVGIMVFATWNDLVQLRIVDFVKNLVS